MKTIPIWSALLFIISYFLLYTLGAFSFKESSSDLDLKTTPISLYQIGVPPEDVAQVSIDSKEAVGNLRMINVRKK